MQIEIRILNKEFYSEERNGMLMHPLPSFATPGSAGVDLYSTEEVILHTGDVKMISTGIAIHIASGIRDHSMYCTKNAERFVNLGSSENVAFMGLIVPRSGLGSKGLVLGNTVGIIDSDYTGEIKISAWNRLSVAHISTEENTFVIEKGDRIAQMLFLPCIQPVWNLVDKFSNSSERGEDGFGSSGK
jgi:dUTP pyrophosphatase